QSRKRRSALEGDRCGARAKEVRRSDAGGQVSMAELCRAFGISRKTAYKWWSRFEANGVAGLSDRSRARLTQANATEEDVVKMIIGARRPHPTWGPRKLKSWLEGPLQAAQWTGLLSADHRRRLQQVLIALRSATASGYAVGAGGLRRGV